MKYSSAACKTCQRIMSSLRLPTKVGRTFLDLKQKKSMKTFKLLELAKV